MARRRYREAAKVAIILANNEQVKGNFFVFSTVDIFLTINYNCKNVKSDLKSLYKQLLYK